MNINKYTPLLQRLVKDHDLIVIIGYAGSGKTVLASQLGANKIVDDFNHMTLKSGSGKYIRLHNQIITSRHYGKTVICTHLPISDIIHKQNPCYFVLGVHATDINFISTKTGIRKDLLKIICNKYFKMKRSRKPIKTRPYLFASGMHSVTDSRYKDSIQVESGKKYYFGRFKKEEMIQIEKRRYY